MEVNRKVFLNRWFAVTLLLGMVALTASLLAVHVFHLKPCVMCKLQRIPFVLLIVNSVFGLIGSYKQGFFKVLQVCLAIGIIFGLIHFLMQMGAVPDFCRANRGFGAPEEFSTMLMTSKCSDIAWSIGGVPVSLINSLIHALTLGFSLVLNFKKDLRGLAI